MAAAGGALLDAARGADAAAAAAAAAALRLALEAPDARRRLEGLLAPGAAAALLGPLPPAPPAFRYVVALPSE
jgi:hypothetical protein